MIDIELVQLNATHESDFVYGLKADFWLLLFVKTPALFHLPTGDVATQPNSAILYPPNSFAYYQANGDSYINDYVRFHTDESFVFDENIPTQTPVLLRSPYEMERLFELLSIENYYQFSYAQQSISMLMRMMFLKMKESVADNNMTEPQRALIDLRYEIQLHPYYAWTVGYMASRLHVSAGYLQNIYKKQFGVSCMQDVVEKRIDLAKKQLVLTNFTSQKIANLCGYQNVEHFCRQFKAVTGMSPLTYRKHAQAEKNIQNSSGSNPDEHKD